jgi:hypothetical protein
MHRIIWTHDPSVSKSYYLKLWVETKLIDAAWKQDGDSYIGPGGEGGDPALYRQVAAEICFDYLAVVPIITLTGLGVKFETGRYHAAYLRDQGALALRVLVRKDEAGEVHRRFRSRMRETVIPGPAPARQQ